MKTVNLIELPCYTRQGEITRGDQILIEFVQVISQTNVSLRTRLTYCLGLQTESCFRVRFKNFDLAEDESGQDG
jgi:hypothetical protein